MKSFVLPMLLAAGLSYAAAPAPSPVTADLVEAATKEGRVVFYTIVDVTFAQKMAKAFEAKYPGVAVQVERSGAERNLQRLAQEYASGIHNADLIESSDLTHFIGWKKDGWLVPYVPEGAQLIPEKFRDPDGIYVPIHVTLEVMGYNTRMVKAEDAPKSALDLLDPKWSGKIVKAHPGYSGSIMTATDARLTILGWPYFEKLAKQRVLQVQGGLETMHKVAIGERPLTAEFTEYSLLTEAAKGAPIAPIYASEGTPLIILGAAVAKDAPHPNAARLLAQFLASTEGQQLAVDAAQQRSFNPNVKEPAGRKPLNEIKLLLNDPETTLAHIDEIKKRYALLFGI